MRVLDLRPWPVRLWSGGSRGGGAGGADRPGPTAALTDRLVRHRGARRPAPPPGLAVVSVGNLAFGGTGKTPVTAALAAALAATGRPGAVLTRGYGSRLPGPRRVAPGTAGAGDEARLLAAAVAPAGWTVVQARRRAEGLALLADELPAGAVVILEDGHQTAGVGRHLDVLILDRWSVRDGPAGPRLRPATGPVVPWGPWRESAAGAGRAAIWLVETEEPPPAGEDGRPVAGFVRRLELGDGAGGAAAPPGGPWAALSGIARPERFEAGAADLLGAAPVLAVRCADHEPYGAARLERIVRAVRRAGTPTVVTTEKDWIKLAERWPADLPVRVARLGVRWTGGRALPDLVGERLPGS